jgi:FAD/FMN-containing dehydrogenase
MEQAELEKIVSLKNIDSRPSTLEECSKDLSFTKAMKPAFVVKPENSEEIQNLVLLAKETGTPLIPVSSGPPHFRGDTVPGIGGAVVVDLSGMKKVFHVDRKNRVVMFEPGVTFGELAAAVGQEGLRLNMPLIPRQSKSVIGSMLEREPVIMPKYHWDISDPLACTEVIFGSGDMFRTGAAAGSGTIEEQWAAGGAQKEAAGPSSASLYRVIQGSQGTMGIVTWASARCEIKPQLEEPFFVGSNSLDKMLELMHWLIRLRLVNECFLLNNTNLALIMTKERAKKFRVIKDSLPTWILFYNVAAYDYHPGERIAGQIKDILNITSKLELEPQKELSNNTANGFLKIVQNPSSEPYWKFRLKGAFQDVFFLTIIDKLPELLQTMKADAEEAGYPISDLGIYLQPIVQGANYHCEFTLFYDPKNTAESIRVNNLSFRAIKNLVSKGAFFSRPYGENARMILNRDAATVETLKKVKNILDPVHIMNPGKLCF